MAVLKIKQNGEWVKVGIGAQGKKGDPFVYEDFTEEQLTALRGEPGIPGADGQDGVSVTHEWNDTTLIVTSASGTSSADLKGEKGDAGAAGANGENATINGVTALVIEPGENVTMEQTDNVLKIGVTGGGTSSTIQTVTLTTAGRTDNGDGRYKQTVNVSGVTADTPVILVDVNLTGTDLAADKAVLDAWCPADGSGPNSQNVEQGNGTLTFYCTTIPSVAIPVNVGVC